MSNDKPGTGKKGRYDPIFATLTGTGVLVDRGTLKVEITLSEEANSDRLELAYGPVGATATAGKTFISLFEGVSIVKRADTPVPTEGCPVVEASLPVNGRPGTYGLFGHNYDAKRRWFLLCTFRIK